MDLVLKSELKPDNDSAAGHSNIVMIMVAVAYGDHPKSHLIQKRESALLREQVCGLLLLLLLLLLLNQWRRSSVIGTTWMT